MCLAEGLHRHPCIFLTRELLGAKRPTGHPHHETYQVVWSGVVWHRMVWSVIIAAPLPPSWPSSGLSPQLCHWIVMSDNNEFSVAVFAQILQARCQSTSLQCHTMARASGKYKRGARTRANGYTGKSGWLRKKPARAQAAVLVPASVQALRRRIRQKTKIEDAAAVATARLAIDAVAVDAVDEVPGGDPAW